MPNPMKFKPCPTCPAPQICAKLGKCVKQKGRR